MSDKLFQGGEHSFLYDKFRPVAPNSLVNEIKEYYKGYEISFCVDVGCGTGQFTKLLMPHADRILGTDVSRTQVAEAANKIKDPKVEFRYGVGESIEVEDGSVDLVTISQALHWLKFDAFYSEVDRVLSPRGVLAVIGYHFTRPAEELGRQGDELKKALDAVYSVTAPHWSPHRKLVDNAYKDIPKPGMLREYRRSDKHATHIDATLSDWMGYVSTWSGYQTMRKVEGEEKARQVLNNFKDQCLKVMGREEENPRDVELKLETNFWLILYRK